MPKSARAERGFEIDVPEIMRGTIASETAVVGYESPGTAGYRPIIARGYGLVVGLNGTGSRDIPPQLRAFMLAEAAKGGFGSERFGENIAQMSPEKLLDSPDTAVVIVEAVVPQGALAGTRFDVRVVADPRTGTTSLEGGTLYTTDLRPGGLSTGGAQAAALARASGPVFVNPFAEPGAVGKDTIVRTVGRVLNGGEVIKDMPLKLRLGNPSHARAAILQSAINTRFPQEPRQRDPTARGESDEVLRLHIPPSFSGHTDEFIDLLRHTSIAQSNPEAVAMAVRRTLLANPMVASAASLRWQALGTRVLPVIQDLYDYPEEQPRLAALRAGAKLNDALVIPHLMQMASNGSAEVRLQAIQLLGGMQTNPQVDLALRNLLDDGDVEVRLEAYEALIKRGDPYMRRFAVDNKFLLDIVESTKPMIYITQLGQPRIVLFGSALEIERPATVMAWSNRLMVKGEPDDPMIEVYYRQPDDTEGVVHRTEATVSHLIQFFGHKTTIEKPAPGLGLTYAETVGAIYQIWQQQYIKADFKAEQDRILAAIARLQKDTVIPDRPEFEKPEDDGVFKSDTDFGPRSDLGRLDPNTMPTTNPMVQPPANESQPEPPGRRK